MTRPTPTGDQDAFDIDPDLDPAEVDALVDRVLGNVPRPVNFANLTHGTALTHWVALDRWVRWLVRRYNLDHRDVPPCWYAHSDLVEELSALHTAHRGAYDPGGPAGGPAEWHQTLATTRTHLQLSVSRTGCKPREHRPPAAIDWASEPAEKDYADGFKAHVADDADRRT
ncbi:hypothetical protein [Pengzhenrongella phosphoraccumulans]|uniref:hypothetical protein n=1 Tax=Pengzhenrongella phosphoraccumulans TaxID=3114394 RepID=UPI0038906D84